MGKLGVNPKLFYPDTPTFHVHKDQIGELVREFENAKGMKNSEATLDYIERPQQINRLNSKHEDDNLVGHALKRL